MLNNSTETQLVLGQAFHLIGPLLEHMALLVNDRVSSRPSAADTQVLVPYHKVLVRGLPSKGGGIDEYE